MSQLVPWARGQILDISLCSLARLAVGSDAFQKSSPGSAITITCGKPPSPDICRNIQNLPIMDTYNLIRISFNHKDKKHIS